MLKFSVVILTLIIVVGGLSACAPLATINAVTTSTTYTRTAHIPYGSDPRQQLDVYVPRAAHVNAPVVVYFYGGSWNSGSRRDYAFIGEALAARGMIVVIPDYRLYPQVRYPSFVEDSALAVAWAIREANAWGGDAKKVFVMGHSAGAYNAAMVALDSRWLAESNMKPTQLRGWIGMAGPYDFLPIENPNVQPVFFHPETPLDSQPIRHVSLASPPVLLMAASSDKVVNPDRNTRGLAARLRETGVSVREVYFDRVNHASLIASIAWPLRWMAPTLDEITRFVCTDGDKAACTPEE